MIVVLAAALALAVIWLVVQPGLGAARTLTGLIVIVAALLVIWRSRRQAIARERAAPVLAALGRATADLPVRLRTRMPLVLVTGDDLPALFNRDQAERYAYVGDGAIWLRADQPRDLSHLAVAVRQWRNGRAPDAILLAVVPARYKDADMLTQSLRMVRQAAADTARMLGKRTLPGYLAIYQRLTPDHSQPEDTTPARLATAQWYGISSATRILDAQRFESAIRAAESEADHTSDDYATSTRAAALASIIGWTQRVVISTLTDRRQPATPWSLNGAGWIDCGPASRPISGNGNPWERDAQMHTSVERGAARASSMPWPLPQQLISALPVRLWTSPWLSALGHAVMLLACAAAVAIFYSGKNNQALITRVATDIGHYRMVPADHDIARRDALQALIADRDQLDRYARTGTPLPLSFGLYRGARLITPLNDAIATYQPPPPPPAVVTLDSMSLFDSGRAVLKDGSNRIMVNALEMIKAHPDKRVLVAGHTDNIGLPQSNLKLSTARAEAVRDWLVDASGIPATQFAIQGYGDTRPIATNDTQEGRAKNRRVEITLVPDTPTAPQQAAASPGAPQL